MLWCYQTIINYYQVLLLHVLLEDVPGRASWSWCWRDIREKYLLKDWVLDCFQRKGIALYTKGVCVLKKFNCISISTCAYLFICWYPHCERLFSSIFDNSRKNNGQAPLVTFAPRLYNCYNHAGVPGPHMWPSPGPGPDSKSCKTVEVGYSLRVKPCQRDIATDEIQEKKIIEIAAI